MHFCPGFQGREQGCFDVGYSRLLPVSLSGRSFSDVSTLCECFLLRLPFYHLRITVCSQRVPNYWTNVLPSCINLHIFAYIMSIRTGLTFLHVHKLFRIVQEFDPHARLSPRESDCEDWASQDDEGSCGLVTQYDTITHTLSANELA